MLSVVKSIGVAARADDLLTSDRLFKAADKALYRAKHGGRTG